MKIRKHIGSLFNRATLGYIVSQARGRISGFLRDSKPLDERYPEYEIGRGSYGPVTILTFGDPETLRIGAFTSIGPEVTILLGGEHWVKNISMYPLDKKHFLPKPGLARSHFSKGDVIIGNDVWIGCKTTVLSGAVIGDGAVIGAGSLVRGKIPPYAIAAGNPARVIKYRFDEESIERLLKIQWWNWADARIEKFRPLLLANDLEAFFAAAAEGAPAKE